MFSILCPACGKKASFITENGNINCDCGVSANITELNLPEYGSYKRSKYINEMVKDNSLPKATDLPSGQISCSSPEIIDSSFSAKEIARIIRQWSGHAVFNKHSFNKSVKKMDMLLSYVPLYVYDVKSSMKLDAVASVNDDSSDADKRIMRTHYYNIEHLDIYADIHVKSASDAISDEVLPELLPYDFSTTSTYENSVAADVNVPITVDKDILYKKTVADISAHMKKQLLSSANDYSSIYNYETEEYPFSTNIRTVYVPLWKMNYKDNVQTKTVFINGQSGKIYGSSPLSFIKVSTLTALSGLIIFAIAAAFIL